MSSQAKYNLEEDSSEPMEAMNSDESVINFNNSSLGLQIWGPLVPASDHKDSVFLLASFQGLLSWQLIKRGYKMKYPITTPMAHNNLNVFSNQTTIKVLQWQKLLNKMLKIPIIGIGALFLTGSAMDLFRLTLDYDPFYEEAATIRNQFDTMVAFDEMKEKNEMTSYHEDKISKWGKFCYYWGGPPIFPRIGLDEWLERYEFYSESVKSKTQITTTDNEELSTLFKKQKEQNKIDYLQMRRINRAMFKKFVEDKDYFKKLDEKYRFDDSGELNYDNRFDREKYVAIQRRQIGILNDGFVSYFRKYGSIWKCFANDTNLSLYLLALAPRIQYEPKESILEIEEETKKD